MNKTELWNPCDMMKAGLKANMYETKKRLERMGKSNAEVRRELMKMKHVGAKCPTEYHEHTGNRALNRYLANYWKYNSGYETESCGKVKRSLTKHIPECLFTERDHMFGSGNGMTHKDLA